MDPSHAMAEQSVGSIWGEGDRLGLIDATPMRPGHGRRAGHPKGRRIESQGGQERFDATIRSVEAGLRLGSLTPDAARQRIDESGFDEFIRVAETRSEAVEAFARFFGLGYYLWRTDGEPDGPGSGLIRASFATRKELT